MPVKGINSWWYNHLGIKLGFYDDRKVLDEMNNLKEHYTRKCYCERPKGAWQLLK